MDDAEACKTPETSFTEHERPTRPFARLRTSTSRWRAVASAAIQRGFGRKSDGDFHLGNAPDAAAPEDAPGDLSEHEDELAVDVDFEEPQQGQELEVAGSVSTSQERIEPTTEPSLQLGEAPRPVMVRVDRPTRDFGPRGTVRMVPRRDLGPTGTVLIRRRPQRGWLERHRLWVKVASVAAACALVIVVGYRGSPPAPAAAAMEAALPPPAVTIAPLPAVTPTAALTPDSPVDALTPTSATPVSALPVAHATPRRATMSKAPRTKSTVF